MIEIEIDDYTPTRQEAEAAAALLNGAEFGTCFLSDGRGGLREYSNEYAPEVYFAEGGGAGHDIDFCGADWSELTGYTGQYSYYGGIMHQSEFVSRAMAEEVLTAEGVYALVVVECLPDEEGDDLEPAGWALVRRGA